MFHRFPLQPRKATGDQERLCRDPPHPRDAAGWCVTVNPTQPQTPALSAKKCANARLCAAGVARLALAQILLARATKSACPHSILWCTVYWPCRGREDTPIGSGACPLHSFLHHARAHPMLPVIPMSREHTSCFVLLGCRAVGSKRLFSRSFFGAQLRSTPPCADFAFSANPNCRKGGLIGLAAIAIALGQQSDTILKCVRASLPFCSGFESPRGLESPRKNLNIPSLPPVQVPTRAGATGAVLLRRCGQQGAVLRLRGPLQHIEGGQA